MTIFVGTNAFIQSSSSSNPFDSHFFRIGSNQYGGATIYETGFTSPSGTRVVYKLDIHTPGFIVGSFSDPGFVNFANNIYAKLNVYNNSILFNRGNHYSTSTTRFTAPISGPYHFIWAAYGYFTNSNGYMLPLFYVNGSSSSRRYNTPFRIRGHGYTSGYPIDLAMEEIIYLSSGDFVEVYAYGTTSSYYLPGYSLFSGFYVG